MLDLVVLADDRPASSVGGTADAAPARPEDEREQCADCAHCEKDPTDRVNLDAADRRVDSPDEDCSDGYQCTGNLPFGITVPDFQCQTPLDECQSDYDCPGTRERCVSDGERRYCFLSQVG